MQYRAFTVVAAAALAVTGCAGGKKAAQAENGNAAAEANAADTAGPDAIERDWIIGTWVSDRGACAPLPNIESDYYQIRPDGSFVGVKGMKGEWRLSDTTLTFIWKNYDPDLFADMTHDQRSDAEQSARVRHDPVKVVRVSEDEVRFNGATYYRCK